MLLEEYYFWNEYKKALTTKDHDVFFKERDIFFVSMGKNVRFEQNGKGNDFARPVVVIKKFNNDIFWGVPLSTKEKQGPYYFSFDACEKTQCAILSQLNSGQKQIAQKKQKIKDLI